MANSKISALTSATTPLAGTETLPIVQGGVTKKVAVADLTAGRSVATGNLTTTGTMAFTVNTADASGLTGTNSNNSAYFTLMVGGSSGFGVSNWANSTILESVPASTGGLVLGSYTGKTYFQIGRFSYMDLSSSALTFTSINLTQGTAAKGINFTANSALSGKTSQLLNWYEEGTFTPTWNGGTVTTNSSYYTRVGRLVTWILDVVFGSSASGTDSQLTLPFTATGSWGGGSINYSDYGTGMTVNVDAVANRLLFRGAVNSSNLACSSVASKRFICVVTYFA